MSNIYFGWQQLDFPCIAVSTIATNLNIFLMENIKFTIDTDGIWTVSSVHAENKPGLGQALLLDHIGPADQGRYTCTSSSKETVSFSLSVVSEYVLTSYMCWALCQPLILLLVFKAPPLPLHMSLKVQPLSVFNPICSIHSWAAAK